jgi:CDP-diacylglycerol--glycerol-3-phosphate 3-phosphatidyltransferase
MLSLCLAKTPINATRNCKYKMFTVPNILSILRAPLALCFLSEQASIRLTAVILAMITDTLDGYIARRQHCVTQLGALLDPLMDKFFMLFAFSVYLFDQQLVLWQVAALLSRDFAVGLYGIYLGLTNELTRYHLRSIWAGKVTTASQFFVLICIIRGFTIPNGIFYAFIVLGGLALLELTLSQRQVIKSNKL